MNHTWHKNDVFEWSEQNLAAQVRAIKTSDWLSELKIKEIIQIIENPENHV